MKVDPNVSWRHCCIHRQSLAAKHLPRELNFVLDEAVKVLAAIRKAIVARDQEVLVDIFKQAKAKREGLDKGHAG